MYSVSSNLTRGTIVVSRATQWMDLTHPVSLLREGSRLCFCMRTTANEGDTLSPASLRDRTGDYGSPDRRSNRLLETYTAEGRHSV